jgi:tRNA threonylcarbamoyladenosine biosynthesis protein TsaB
MLLAIDTSTRKMGIALYDGVQVQHESVWESRNHHTVELSPAIETALAQAGLGANDLEAVAVAIGPGSYTGLRIGLAVAKGLALANRAALIGVPTLDVIAYAQPVREKTLAAVLKAGRGRLAVGWYTARKKGGWKQKGEPEVLTPEELYGRIRKPTQICGELDGETRKLLERKHKNAILASPAENVRRPSFLAELGWERWKKEAVDQPALIAPQYLHTGGEPIPG